MLNINENRAMIDLRDVVYVEKDQTSLINPCKSYFT